MAILLLCLVIPPSRIHFLYRYVIGSVVFVILNLPLYIFKIKVSDDWLRLDWLFAKIDISSNSIKFIGVVWRYKNVVNKKVFTYGIVYDDSGTEKTVTFPKPGKLQKLINLIFEYNLSIESDLRLTK